MSPHGDSTSGKGLPRHFERGGFPWTLAAAEALLFGLVFLFVLREREGALDFESAALLVGALLPFELAALAAAGAAPGLFREAALIAVAGLGAAFTLPFTFAYLQIPLDRHVFAAALAGGALGQLALRRAHRRFLPGATAEPLRWMILAAGTGLVALPFLGGRLVGTGDAYWYSAVVGDFVTQLRAGFFPIFAGQSTYAFNGAVFPLRFAPYLQLAAGALDLLTGQVLSPVALLNLVIALSLAGGAYATYFSLTAIEPRRRWAALCLALLYLSSPAALALVYTGNLFMSVCTLPYLPLLLLGQRGTFAGRPRAELLVAAALAALWLCHPPIAFWATVVILVGQLVRLPAECRSRKAWLGWIGMLAIFSALTAALFISVATLRLPAIPTERVELLRNLVGAFPACLLPVSATAATLSDYQLGWSLWGLLAIGGASALLRRDRYLAALMLPALLLTLLLLPIPGVQSGLWRIMPQFICDLTFSWPMQRLYIVLAALAVFAGHAAWCDARRKGRAIGAGCGALAAAALFWSGIEAMPFLRGGLASVHSAAETNEGLLPQNRVLTRYSYSPFPVMPPYFSHGYVDPVWENRVLARDTLRELDSNYRSATGPAATIRAAGPLPGRQEASDSPFYLLLPALPLVPGRTYALEMALPSRLSGVLMVSGTTVNREYLIPDSGTNQDLSAASAAFGTGPTEKKSFPLRSSAAKAEPLLVQFVASPAPREKLAGFGRFALREYDEARLPVVISSWVPYRAAVVAPAAAWLETPRLFIAGYEARVNGRKQKVTRGPTGLVLVPLEPGPNDVTLTYPGPRLLRLAFWFSAAAWLGLPAAAYFSPRRGGRSRIRSAAQ